MNTELLNWVCDYLERDETIVVPIKKMWNDWRDRHDSPSLAEFTALVLADERIEAMGEVDHNADMEFESDAERAAYERDMEAHGYFSGPRVKLKSRELTREHMARACCSYTTIVWSRRSVTRCR